MLDVKQITALCDTLVEFQKAFMDRITITTEITIIQILDDVGTLSVNLISDHPFSTDTAVEVDFSHPLPTVSMYNLLQFVQL